MPGWNQSDVHKSIGNLEHSGAMTLHMGKKATYQKVSEIFLAFKCQRDLKFPRTDLKLILNLLSIMKQVGLDLCSLPVIGGCCHVVILIDYFWK